MSRIDDLIAGHCPDGVEHRPLEDLGEFIRGRRFTKANYVAYSGPASRGPESAADLRKRSGERRARISLLIPLPSLKERERIVAILDKFDALVNDLSVGPPAETVACRKQYEFCRDKLLTLEEAA